MQFFTLCLAIGALVASNLVEARTGFVMKHVPRASTNSTSTSISSSSSTMTGSKNCNSYFCVRTVLDSASSTLTYSLTTLGAPSGWYAVGTGSQMAGSTMWVVWAPSNGNGEIEWSERMATGNVEPNVVSTPSASYISTQSTTNSTGLEAIWTTSYSGSPDANYPLIWAVNPSDTPGAASGASINQHSVHGQMTMDLTTPVESNATVTDTSSSSGGGGRTYNTLIKIHIVCMSLAWMIAAPLAILLARYGRSTTFKWVKSHQLIQIIGTGGLTLAGFGLAVAAVAIAGERQFGGSHQVLGLVITIIIFVQMAAGIWVHRTYDPKRVRRPARNWGHMIMGMGILVAAYVNLFLGVHRWVEGKTWMYAVFGAWAVIVVVLFAVGYALIPRQLRREASAKKERDMNMSNLTTESNTPPESASPG